MKKNDMIDLGSIDTVSACNKGVEIELRHPATNEPIGIHWTVVGSESDTFKDYMRTKINERIRKEAMARKRGRDPEIKTIEDSEEDTIELLTVCSLGWRTGDSKVIKFNGADLEFNVQNAKKILAERAWIRKQLDDAIGDLGNFMTN